MKEVTNLNNKYGVRWVPIIDAGVKFTGEAGVSGQS